MDELNGYFGSLKQYVSKTEYKVTDELCTHLFDSAVLSILSLASKAYTFLLHFMLRMLSHLLRYHKSNDLDSLFI